MTTDKDALEALEDLVYVHTRNKKFNKSFRISDKTYEKIRKALQAQEWHDISTAPRDGTKFLTYDGWYIEIHWWCDDGSVTYKNHSVEPTHWKPLPPPPKENEILTGAKQALEILKENE